MTARPIQLDREPRTPALSAYPRVYLPTVTGDSREHPLFTILRIRTTKAIESHLKERKRCKRRVLDGALAYSNLLQTRSSARRAGRPIDDERRNAEPETT